MDISPTTIILVGLVCVVLGFIASVLLNTLRDEPEFTAGDGAEAPPGGRKGKYEVVAKLWRDRTNGALLVEMDGKTYLGIQPLDEQQRGRLEAAARDLDGWVGGAPMPAARPAPRVEAPAVASRPASDMDMEIAKNLDRAVGLPVEPAPRPVPPPPVTQRSAPAAPPTAAAKPAAAAANAKNAPVVETKSIVMQIEDMLQDRIAGTPLAQQGIHLRDDPIRGVIVEIGPNHYEGIDSVPDPEIKAVIRSAVQAWESKQ